MTNMRVSVRITISYELTKRNKCFFYFYFLRIMTSVRAKNLRRRTFVNPE